MKTIEEVVTARAVKERWTLEQIQFAEDYISKLREHQYARKPVELTGRNARIIRNLYKARRSRRQGL